MQQFHGNKIFQGLGVRDEGYQSLSGMMLHIQWDREQLNRYVVLMITLFRMPEISENFMGCTDKPLFRFLFTTLFYPSYKKS
jgi:hypothetical protein